MSESKTRKFKVGDEVVASDRNGYVEKGTKGVVTKLEPKWYTGGLYFKVLFEGQVDELWLYERDVEFDEKSKIVIYVEGKDVIAKNTKTGKIAKATCHPDDEFDFSIGAKLAFERLMRRIVKQDSYEVGDKVKIVDKWNKDTSQNPDGDMDKYLGTIMTIKDVFGNGYGMQEDSSDRCGLGWYWNKHCIEGKVVDDSITPKKVEPKFKKGDVVELLEEVYLIPKGTHGEFVKYSPIGNCLIDFKFDYGCTHTADGTLTKRTGRYINERKLKKVDA